MVDILTTGLIPLVLFLIVLFPDKRSDGENFFSKNYTTALKGLAAIVVIFVHVPAEFGNKLQDAIGSFAYVAVTYFFLVSAFGMQLASETKSGYLRSFWKNRFASLLIPMVLVNIVCYGASALLKDAPELSLLLSINSYVAVLLTYCVWFWCLEMIGKRLKLSRRTIDLINISGVVITSLLLYFSDTRTGWCYERIGLVWGLLLFRYFPSFMVWLGRSERLKKALFLVASLLLGVLYLKYKELYFWGGYLVKIALGVALLVCLSLWSRRVNFNNKILLFLGGISYEIYLLHAVVMEMLKDHVNVSSGVFILITVVITIVLAYVINLIAAPLVRKVRGMKKRQAQ